MAQWSRALVLMETPGSIPNSHPVAHNFNFVTLAPQDLVPPDFFFKPLQAPGIHKVQTHLDNYSYM